MKPNLFIVGAGKAGTFALYEYLKQHSDIYMAPKKEPDYFGRDLKFNQPRITEEEYLALFNGADGYSYCGEASVGYLLSETASDEIKDFNDQAKIIIIVRDPVEVMYSRHGQNLKAGIETIRSFERALAAEADRKKGIRMPTGVTCDDWLYYRNWVKYSVQIERYLSCFYKENIFVALYDDLKANPARLYLELMQFLRLPSDSIPRFEIVNSHEKVRSTLITRLTRGRIPFSCGIARFFLPNKALRKSLLNILRQVNSVKTRRKPLSRELDQKLRTECEAEVSYLETLLDRDLSHWKAQRSTEPVE
jgi:hypothetical protein